jgi:nucleoid-associated protein EbfC
VRPASGDDLGPARKTYPASHDRLPNADGSRRERSSLMPGMPSMKMIQQMQNRIVKIQQELEETEVEGTAGGGVVTAIATGSKAFKSIKIDKSVVDPDDVEMLEDLINAAIKDAMDKATKLSEEKMGALTGGMKIPGLGL